MDRGKLKHAMRNSLLVPQSNIRTSSTPTLEKQEKSISWNLLGQVRPIDGLTKEVSKPHKLQLVQATSSVILESAKIEEQDHEDIFDENLLPQEEFDKEISQIHNFLPFDFKTSSFSSKILIDTFAAQGWYKIQASFQNINQCSLLWLSRIGSNIDADRTFLKKFFIINKIQNLDALVQPEVFNANLTFFLDWFNERKVSFHLLKYRTVELIRKATKS